MPDLLPVAPLELDPRNQGQIVEEAIDQVFIASGGLINNFSAGSPALCLIEGQAFTNAEFLFWLNKLPNAFLATWLQHYCGIQRKTESSARVDLTFTLSQPLIRPFIVLKNYRARVPSIINNETVSFVTESELVIPAGSSSGVVSAKCEVSGVIGNVSAGSITQPESNLAFLASITNFNAASGGTDAEEESDTISRAFFHTLSYRHPVTSDDWTNIIKVRTGLDTQVYYYVDRSSLIHYFYLLKENDLSQTQLSSLQTFLQTKAPVNFEVVVANFLTQYVDVYLEVSDPNTLTSATTILNFLKQDVFLINSRFNFDNNIQGLDIASIFANQFSYIDPNLDKIEVYSTNPDSSANLAIQRTTKYQAGDLLYVAPFLYPVLIDFDPIGSSFTDYISNSNAVFRVALTSFVSGNLLAGTIYYIGNTYYQVPTNGYYSSFSQLIILVPSVYSPSSPLLSTELYISSVDPTFTYQIVTDINTQDDLTTLILAQAANVVGTTPISVPLGVPSTNSGYVTSVIDDAIYFNLTVVEVLPFSKGHKYVPRYQIDTTILESGNYKYIYKDHTPNINKPYTSVFSVATTITNNYTTITTESFVKDLDGVIYQTNIANSNDVQLTDRELDGFFTRENKYYEPNSTVIKEGVQYAYRLRRAVLKYNGTISQTLFGVPLLSNTFVDYLNR